MLTFANTDRIMGYWNYHIVQFCRKCQTREAKRECIDCEAIDERSRKKYCLQCFELKHNRGTKKKHTYYQMTYYQDKPIGFKKYDGKKEGSAFERSYQASLLEAKKATAQKRAELTKSL